MDTRVLHSSGQRFPTQLLRLQLEDELDKLLIEEVKERERQDRARKVRCLLLSPPFSLSPFFVYIFVGWYSSR